MKLVQEEDETGCGMACVAMLSGTDYFTSCRSFFRTKSGRGKLTSTKDVRVALRRAGLSSGHRLTRFKKGETCAAMKTDAVLHVRPYRRRKAKIGHWVVWDSKNRKILDPKKKPYKRLWVHSYLPVYRN